MSEDRSPDESGAPTGPAGEMMADTARGPAVPRPERDAEVADLKDRLLRALAEQENIRRRASREREDAARFGASGLARDLLPTVDNLRRALESLPEDEAADETLQRFLAGVAATERELLAALEKHGIRRIDPLGEPFDPHRHQAMFEVTDTEHPAGTVAQVVQPGYLHHDRLLRPAMVGVAGRGGDFAEADPGSVVGES